MRLQIIDDLPFITATIAYGGSNIEIPNVLIDTGSATSIFNADLLNKIHLSPDPDDILFTIRGVGGSEVVFSRRIDFIQVDKQKVQDFQIEVGGMDYGFEIFGILGMNFLIQSGAIIDLRELTLDFHSSSKTKNPVLKRFIVPIL